MRSVRICLVLAALVAISAGVRADEEKVPVDKLPRAVLDAVKKRFPDAEVVGGSREVEGGKTMYEVAVKNQGQHIDVTLTPDGTITELEKEIPAGRLPKTVSDALEEKYPRATVKKAEEVIHVKDGREKLAYYEVVLVTAAKKKLEVEVTPDGKIKHEEDKSKEKD